MVLPRTPEWGIKPVPDKHKMLGGLDYFILWSSLGVGLLVLSAGSFLSKASFLDAIFAIIVGSVVGSILLALAGKIGSDHGIPSLITMRPAFGIRGSYLPAILNILQLVGWTTFEIMIMARAADMLTGSMMPYYFWAAIFGVLVALLGIAGPLNVVRQWIGKFAVWIAYGTSAIIIINLINSADITALISSPGEGLSFFSAIDLVIAMPVSWMPLVADYNRFSKKSKSALWGTFIGFTMTNILFYFGGILIGTSDVLAIMAAIQAIFFGFLMLLLIVDEADNAFADVYSASVSTQDIFPKISQKYLIVGFTALSAILAMVVSIEQYRSVLAFDRSNICSTFWSRAHRLLHRKEAKIHRADALCASKWARHRSTCNNCMDSWGSAKLHTVSPLAHLHTGAAGYRCDNPEPRCRFSHLSCNNKDAAASARGSYDENLE